MNEQVIYRVEKDGECLAVFPYEKWDNRGHVAFYARIGQHGGCCYDYVLKKTKPAKPEQYQSLHGELTSIGYNLEIIKRRNFNKFRKAVLND